MRTPLSVRFPAAIVIVAFIAMLVAGAIGGDVEKSLSSGGFEDPGAESAVASQVMADEFGNGRPDLVVLVSSLDRSRISEGAAAEAGKALAAELAARDDVFSVADYWSLGTPPPLASEDGTRALMLVRLAGGESERLEIAASLSHDLAGERGPIRIGFGGESAVFSEANEIIEADLVRAELLAFPITLILLILIFGSVVSALLPLGIGGLSIIGTFFVLEVVAGFTEVSIFALNFTTALGLGLGIDYALLVVNRYREELADGHDTRTAVTRTVRTAGRTVIFSALTVASSLAALLVFQFAFLRSFAYAGIAVVALAATGAVLVLPAALMLLGHRVNALQIREPKVARAGDDGMWHKIAMFVMRRPVPIATVSILFLLALALPFRNVNLGFPDDRVLPPSAESRIVGDILRDEFSSQEQGALTVVLRGVDAALQPAELDAYAAELSRADGAGRVESPTGFYVNGVLAFPASVLPPQLLETYTADAGTLLRVVPDVEPVSNAGEELARQVRAADHPESFGDVLVGGSSAELLDGKQGLVDRLPVALIAITVITFIVLFMSFGSILMPIKAIILNLLSLTATLGAMVWVFQEGRFEELLGFTATGSLTVTMPILLFILAFGLSMDYEVFLLSRIKEEFDRTGDDIASVALGLERTGRIVTAAAVLIAVVFIAFGLTANVSFMILFGLGMTLAVLVDAFIVRATLVPAFMRLAGSANWWAPAPLRRFHDRFGFSEHVDLDEEHLPA